MEDNVLNKKYLQESRDRALDFMLIHAAETAGIYRELIIPSTVEHVANKLSLDKRAVDITLKALAGLGLLDEKENMFALSRKGREMFSDENSPEYIGKSHRHSMHIMRRWMDLPEILRTGKPSSVERNEEGQKAFMQAMNSRPDQTIRWTVEQCIAKTGKTGKVLDIGGGPGSYAKIFAETADLVVLEDLPNIIDYVGDAFELKNIKNIELVKGDMSVFLPEGPFDIAFMGDITHMWPAETIQNIFSRIAKILAPGGVLGIVDFVRGHSEWAPTFAVNMLVNTQQGSTYTFDEYTSWLKTAGFSEISICNIPERDSQLVTASIA